MRVVATMPGRFGDILWALPTVRALAERHDQPVEIYVSKKYGDESFLELIGAQDYIDKAEAIETWEVEETAPMTPRTPPTALGVLDDLDEADVVYHLGYPEWPSKSLPYDIAARTGVLVNLERPWVTWEVQGAQATWLGLPTHWCIVVGWTPEWKELKLGLINYLANETNLHPRSWPVPPGSPYLSARFGAEAMNWTATADAIASAYVFLGDLSAHWVLACALGTPAVIVEPEPMRHHPIFWVDIKDVAGRRMTRIVKGHDGKPTFDWNHVADELKAAWEEFS